MKKKELILGFALLATLLIGSVALGKAVARFGLTAIKQDFRSQEL